MVLEDITFGQAKMLKKLDFPQDSRVCYNEQGIKVYALPEHSELYSVESLEMVAKWLRDEHKMLIVVGPMYHQLQTTIPYLDSNPINLYCNTRWFDGYCYYIDKPYDNNDGILAPLDSSEAFKTYEDALSAGITHALKILNFEEII